MANLDNYKIYYQNARGLRTKTSKFFRNLCSHDYDMVIITETWLLDSIADAELFDDRYVVFRRDRNYSATAQIYGGGVLIAVRRDIAVTTQPTFHSSAEDLWLTVSLKQRGTNDVIKLNLCVIYLCHENGGFSHTQQLQNFLNKLSDIVMRLSSNRFLLVGDFNLSGIGWVPNTAGESYLDATNLSTYSEMLLVDEMITLGFNQFNGILNKHGRILDLVFSNDSVLVTDCSDDSLVPIDQHHGALNIELMFAEFTPLNSAANVKYLFNKGDYEAINYEISKIDWKHELSSRSLEEAVEYFYGVFLSLREEYIPRKRISASRFPPWYSPALKKVIKEKFKFLNKFKIYGNRAHETSFKMLRERCRTLEESCYQSYINSIEISVKDNPKVYWSFIRSKSKTNEIPSIMKCGDSTYNTGQMICKAFSNYFHSNFLDTPIVLNDYGNLTSAPTVTDIKNIYINIDEVTKLLLKLDPAKSAGPDSLPALFLINCAKTIAVPITLLYKKSLLVCSVPNIWKSAFITPVFKKGSRLDVANYRPISKLCIVAKVLERIVYEQLYSALEHSFSSAQHGFLKGRSVVSNLVILNETLTAAMDSGHQVDVVYTDYSKAFDRIRPDLLLLKLLNIGVSGDLLRWLTAYIYNRSQAVVIKNYISGWLTVPSGVPQGSILGPLLFAVFVNDIEQCLEVSQLLCFADDMKIIYPISSLADAASLQSDLIRLDKYCEENCLDLNPSKCCVVTYSRKRKLVEYDYTLKNVSLSRETVVRDLGVFHDSKLLFDAHIDSIVSKASRALGFLMRTSSDFKQAKTLKILYCSLVRSNLEFASQVWSPRYLTYISRLENVQKRFIKFLCYRTKERYDESRYLDLCKQFHFLPLDKRREIADLVYLSKIASGEVNCPELLAKLKFKTPSKPVRFNNLLCIPPASSNYRQNSYLWRACGSFNLALRQVNLDLFTTSEASIKKHMSLIFFDKLLSN